MRQRHQPYVGPTGPTPIVPSGVEIHTGPDGPTTVPADKLMGPPSFPGIDLSKKKDIDPWELATQRILLGAVLAVILAAPVAAAARVAYDVARWAWGIA